MIVKSAKKMTNLLLKKNLIIEDQEDIYQYSFELLISTLINLFFILFLGLIFHSFWETLVFLLFFCSLKRYTGGFHMPNYRSCICFFCILYTLLLAINKYFTINLSSSFLLFVFMCVFFIVCFSPIESKNKKLTVKEKKLLSLKAIILVSIYNLLFISFYLLNFMQVTKYIGYAIIFDAILMAEGILQNYWEVQHD